MSDRDLQAGWRWMQGLAPSASWYHEMACHWYEGGGMQERPDPLAPPEGYGGPAAQEPAASDGASCCYGECTAAPEWRLFAACPHEHVARLPLCGGHERMHEKMLMMCAAVSPATGRMCGELMLVARREPVEPGTPEPPGEVVRPVQGALDRLFRGD